MMCKLKLIALVSSLWIAGFHASVGFAHEVLPAIADLEVSNGQVTFVLDLNLEAYLSGIDLDGLQDTDEAGESKEYNDLRALEPEDLAVRVPSLIAAWNEVPLVSIDGQDVALVLEDTQIGPVEDVELPRASKLKLIAAADGDLVQIAWPKGAGELVLRQQGVDAPFTGYIAGGETSPPIRVAGGDAQTAWQAFSSYVPVGFDHILPKGLDHILFVLGLFFLSAAIRPLLWQVTAFTAAHTVTLALGALGWVSVPGSIVEPLIAASIVYVAVENIFLARLTSWRPLIIFGFGLLHGLGFASVLGEFGLPDDQFIPALLGFNVGVEVGQLTVIALAALLVGWFASRDWYRKVISIPASFVIALIGAWWVVERTLL